MNIRIFYFVDDVYDAGDGEGYGDAFGDSALLAPVDPESEYQEPRKTMRQIVHPPF